MLPQRRKSAEEIAKLRESLGIPGGPEGEAELEAPIAPAPAPARSFAPSPPVVEAPIPRAAPSAKEEPEPGQILAGSEEDEDAEPVASEQPKQVRSLRKSEQGPVLVKASPPVVSKMSEASAIPQRRHSDRELMEMRRIQAAPPDRSISHLRHMAVAWPLIALGYALPVLGGLSAWLSHWMPTVMPLDYPAQWMADLSRQPWLGKAGFILLCVLCGLGLVFSGSVAWKKPRSRHHAGFITIIAVLILAFGIIHHFSPTYGP